MFQICIFFQKEVAFFEKTLFLWVRLSFHLPKEIGYGFEKRIFAGKGTLGCSSKIFSGQ